MSDNKREIKIAIYVGDYIIESVSKDSFWLQNKDGEGMGISNDDLAKMFAEWMDKHF